jgi:hypothetical protein
MTKKGENLFWFYRGQHDPKQSGDTQLENNFTKALFIVLKNCGEFRKAFLSKFLRVSSRGDIYFDMQKSKPANFEREKKPVLFILSQKTYEPKKKKNKNRKSLPDGWIITENENVLVEVKISGLLYKDQLKRHEKIFGKTARRVYKTWDDLAVFLKKERRGIHGEIERFLLNQFSEFLEVEGMTKFNGFNEEDLNYFKSEKKEEKEEKHALRRKFTNFMKAVENDRHLPRRLKPYLVGNLKSYSKEIWFSIPLRKTPHFNIGVQLELEELSIMLSSPTHLPQDGRKFVEDINNRQTNVIKFFKRHPDLTVSLYKREEGQKKEKYKSYDLWKPLNRISVQMLNAGVIDIADIRKQFEKIDSGALGKSKGGINIRYSIPRAKLLKMNSKETTDETVNGIKIMDQLARRITGKG